MAIDIRSEKAHFDMVRVPERLVFLTCFQFRRAGPAITLIKPAPLFWSGILLRQMPFAVAQTASFSNRCHSNDSRWQVEF